MFVGTAKIYLERCEEAVDWLRRSVEANRNNPLSHVFLAAAMAAWIVWMRRRPRQARRSPLTRN